MLDIKNTIKEYSSKCGWSEGAIFNEIISVIFKNVYNSSAIQDSVLLDTKSLMFKDNVVYEEFQKVIVNNFDSASIDFIYQNLSQVKFRDYTEVSRYITVKDNVYLFIPRDTALYSYNESIFSNYKSIASLYNSEIKVYFTMKPLLLAVVDEPLDGIPKSRDKIFDTRYLANTSGVLGNIGTHKGMFFFDINECLTGVMEVITQREKGLYPLPDIKLGTVNNISNVTFCSATDQGDRDYQEDRYLTFDGNLSGHPIFFSAVFDGHGLKDGHQVSEYLKNNFKEYLLNFFKNKKVIPGNVRYMRILLTSLVINLDYDICHMEFTSGSTATMILMFKDTGDVYLINLGDSRTVIFDAAGRIILESYDHKPTEPSETKRIKSVSGGAVEDGRVVYNRNSKASALAVSRAFGDRDSKNLTSKITHADASAVSPVPNIFHYGISQNVSIVLASDGIWDGMSSHEATKYLTIAKSNSTKTKSKCDKLVGHIRKKIKKHCDNITAVILTVDR